MAKKCAVGALIADAFYSPDFEGIGVHAKTLTSTDRRNALHAAITASGWPVDDRAINLYHRMQTIHDRYQPNNWERLFADTAAAFNLELPPV